MELRGPYKALKRLYMELRGLTEPLRAFIWS